TAYFIERSANGVDFEQLHEAPFISSDNFNDSIYQNYFVYTDSIPANYKLYYYRIMGLNPFAELSTPSLPRSIMGRDLAPPSSPTNVKATQVGPAALEITWDYDLASNPDLMGFFI